MLIGTGFFTAFFAGLGLILPPSVSTQTPFVAPPRSDASKTSGRSVGGRPCGRFGHLIGTVHVAELPRLEAFDTRNAYHKGNPMTRFDRRQQPRRRGVGSLG